MQFRRPVGSITSSWQPSGSEFRAAAAPPCGSSATVLSPARAPSLLSGYASDPGLVVVAALAADDARSCGPPVMRQAAAFKLL